MGKNTKLRSMKICVCVCVFVCVCVQKKQANNLSATDLARAEALGKGVAAGAANARLVGGRWK